MILPSWVMKQTVMLRSIKDSIWFCSPLHNMWGDLWIWKSKFHAKWGEGSVSRHYLGDCKVQEVAQQNWTVKCNPIPHHPNLALLQECSNFIRQQSARSEGLYQTTMTTFHFLYCYSAILALKRCEVSCHHICILILLIH